jgi:hypothetical protein
MKQNLKEEIERNLELMELQLNEDWKNRLSFLTKKTINKISDKVEDFLGIDDSEEDVNIDSEKKSDKEDDTDKEEKYDKIGDEELKGKTSKFNTNSQIPSDFRDMTELVVDVFEGGYYNPDWHYKDAMGKSGETMFGIDREYGSYLEKTSEGSEFWKVIDDNKADFDDSSGKVVTWGHGYDGGGLRDRLLNLVSKMMKKVFDKNMDSYFDDETKKIILSDKGLKFNFYYATWNGSGYFRDFASKIKSAIKRGVTSPMELRKVAIDARRQSKVGRSASKMASLLGV